jgi:hypothetical protein
MDLSLGACGACRTRPTRCAWDTSALESLTLDGRRQPVDFLLPDECSGSSHTTSACRCRPTTSLMTLRMAVETVSRVLTLLRTTRHRVPRHASFKYLRPACTRGRNSAY